MSQALRSKEVQTNKNDWKIHVFKGASQVLTYFLRFAFRFHAELWKLLWKYRIKDWHCGIRVLQWLMGLWRLVSYVTSFLLSLSWQFASADWVRHFINAARSHILFATCNRGWQTGWRVEPAGSQHGLTIEPIRIPARFLLSDSVTTSSPVTKYT